MEQELVNVCEMFDANYLDEIYKIRTAIFRFLKLIFEMLFCSYFRAAFLRAYYQSSHQQCAREVKSLGTAYAVLNYTFVAMVSAVVRRTLTPVSATSVDTSGAILAGSAQLTNIYIRVINKRNNKMAIKTKTEIVYRILVN